MFHNIKIISTNIKQFSNVFQIVFVCSLSAPLLCSYAVSVHLCCVRMQSQCTFAVFVCSLSAPLLCSYAVSVHLCCVRTQSQCTFVVFVRSLNLIAIINLSEILDNSNDLTDLLDIPVSPDLTYEPLKYSENNNYFMCDGIDPDNNIHNNICVDSLYYTETEFKEHFDFDRQGIAVCPDCHQYG